MCFHAHQVYLQLLFKLELLCCLSSLLQSFPFFLFVTLESRSLLTRELIVLKEKVIYQSLTICNKRHLMM